MSQCPSVPELSVWDSGTRDNRQSKRQRRAGARAESSTLPRLAARAAPLRPAQPATMPPDEMPVLPKDSDPSITSMEVMRAAGEKADEERRAGSR